jgi:hypothetical protein
MRKFTVLVTTMLLSLAMPASQAIDQSPQIKEANARGVISSATWSIEYPDFAAALKDDKWVFILKAVSPNTIGEYDTAEFTLADANGKELLSDSGYSSGSNGYIEFYDYVSASDLNGVDLTRDFKGLIKLTRGYGSALKGANITVTIPVKGFPKKPTSIQEYVSLTTSFTSIAYPQSCSSVEFQYNFADPYGEVSTIKFAVVDANGKEITTANAFFTDEGLQKDDFQLCPYALDGTVAPYSMVTTLSFSSDTGKLALTDKIAFPLASKADEAKAKAESLGDYCAKGSTSKVVAAGAACPSGFKKVTFTVPNEIQWNSLTRMPNSQKNKNYIVYACVAQFDANTGGSKFRGYASPVAQQYYFSNGANAIFTGSASQLLKLGENTAFIAKVSVTGGVTYTTLGGKTSVPSLAIKQFQVIGKC